MDENNGSVLRKNDVRLSSQPLAVKAIAKAQSEKLFSQGKFGGRIAVTNFCHDAASGDCVYGVNHLQPPYRREPSLDLSQQVHQVA